ncbi:hypothetical protein predicted by Glimmer/Critica [Lactiplantibacillus plantarum]|nr:hypothetical protein predicted by Glimmer/Critica [Lactiplantibacillus plantarum]
MRGASSLDPALTNQVIINFIVTRIVLVIFI